MVNMRYVKVLGLAALGVALGCQDANQPNGKGTDLGKPAFTVAGAGFTTTNPAVDNPTDDPAIDLCLNGPGTVNCNLYGDKAYVWINGGPNQTGPSALSDGVYFFTVLEPSGQNDPNDGGDNVLSDTDASGGTGTTGGGDSYVERRFTTAGGDISTYLGSTHTTSSSLTQGLLIRLLPYDDTSNPGGVYIMAICRIDLQTSYDPITKTYDVENDPVDPASCKYDAFKAPTGNTVITEFPDVSGLKYYDANVNGKYDAGIDVGIAGWPIAYQNGVSDVIFTGTGGTFTVALVPDVYTFQEQVANAPWMQTGNLDAFNQSLPVGAALLSSFIYTVTVGTEDISGLNFGNVCVGGGGGLTLGYWSNKNGGKVITGPPSLLAGVLALPLRKGNGLRLGSVTLANFQKFLLEATATNMANMLSAQLAAMHLNVASNGVSGTAVIYAPGTNSGLDANNGALVDGFATINAVMAEATELLYAGNATDLDILSGNPLRPRAEALKTALDRGNNNLNFVQSGPTTCPTPVFPS
jgi:hypothetical protein